MFAKELAIGLLPAIALSAAAAPAGYTIVDFGPDIRPSAINADGTVVGCELIQGACAPVIYQGGGWQTLEHSGYASVAAINRKAVMVGDDSSRPVMWSGSHRRVLGGLPLHSTAEGISDDKTVVGTRLDSGRKTSCYSWLANQITILGTLDGGNCYAHAIDRYARYIVGESSYHGFIYYDGVMHDLGRVKGDGLGTRARAVNSHGHVSASSEYDNSGDWAAAYWNGRKLVRVPGVSIPAGPSYGGAMNDNDEMLVAGQNEANQFLFLYDGRAGVTTAIEPLIHNAAGWDFDWQKVGGPEALAAGLNEQGTIVGTATYDNVAHGYMLVPDSQ
jgi:uncharacterized membrane protein